MNGSLMPATPWRRMWARYFDYSLHCAVIVILWLFIDANSLEKVSNNSASLLGFLLMVIWMMLDGVYMGTFGTTLGKKLMLIEVTNQDGTKLTPFIAFKRSRLVWQRGMGLGIGIIQVIANLVGYRKLKRDGVTSWDKDLELRVTSGKIGVIRWLICPLFVIGLSVVVVVSYIYVENY